MARSSTTIEVIRRQTQYEWPSLPLNFWNIIMLVTGGLLIGAFANFMMIQNHFGAGVPWLFPFGITVGALTILFVIYGGALQANPSTQLEPTSIIVISVILFALYLTGVIETAIQLFGSGSNVNSNCQNYVLGSPSYGASVNTLAWLEQQSICQTWYAVFAFWIVGAVFLVWIIVVAAGVNQRSNSRR